MPSVVRFLEVRALVLVTSRLHQCSRRRHSEECKHSHFLGAFNRRSPGRSRSSQQCLHGDNRESRSVNFLLWMLCNATAPTQQRLQSTEGMRDEGWREVMVFCARFRSGR